MHRAIWHLRSSDPEVCFGTNLVDFQQCNFYQFWLKYSNPNFWLTQFGWFLFEFPTRWLKKLSFDQIWVIFVQFSYKVTENFLFAGNPNPNRNANHPNLLTLALTLILITQIWSKSVHVKKSSKSGRFKSSNFGWNFHVKKSSTTDGFQTGSFVFTQIWDNQLASRKITQKSPKCDWNQWIEINQIGSCYISTRNCTTRNQPLSRSCDLLYWNVKQSKRVSNIPWKLNSFTFTSHAITLENNLVNCILECYQYYGCVVMTTAGHCPH